MRHGLRKTIYLSQKEHTQPNFTSQNIAYIAKVLRAARIEDRGTRARRQLLFPKRMAAGLNHSLFMNDQGRSQRGPKKCARKVSSGGRMLGKVAKASGKRS